MKVFYYFIGLSNIIILGHCTISAITDLKCANVTSLTWLWNLRNNNRCLYITSSVAIPQCFFQQISNTKFVVRIISPKILLLRNIYNSSRTNCDNFFVISTNISYVSELFRQKQNGRRFMPFSQLHLVVPDMEFEQNAIDYINRNTLSVFVMENALNEMENGSVSFKTMLNVLTKKRYAITSVRSDAAKYFGNYKDHPFLSNKSREKVFRASLFNCPPYVVYVSGNSKYYVVFHSSPATSTYTAIK